ncbi:MAG: DUF695 domain-containing protein [Pseudomonadota bacterium]
MTQTDWDYYQCNVNDQLSSIFVDLSIARQAPLTSLPILHWHWIRLRFPNDQGMSTDQEFDALCHYQDNLEAAISGSDDIRYVGRITGSGRRELYFYASAEADVEGRIANVISKFPEYQFQRGSKEDAEWRQYLDLLYPGEHGLKQIMSRRTGE